MSNLPTEDLPPTRRPREQPRAARWILGAAGLAIAIAAAIVQWVGVEQAVALNWQTGTTLAWVAAGLSVGAFAVGLAAVILNRGRRLGAVAMVLAVAANPLVLVWLFGLFG